MGVKISNLPAVVTPSMSDIFPIVQGGVTYKETFTQLATLFAPAGSGVLSVTGTANQVLASPSTGNVVLSLPQDIATNSSPTFDALTLTSVNFGGSVLSSYVSETSWTPTITFATPGDLSVVYSSQIGLYTRIGSIVFYRFVCSFTPTFTTASGNLQVTGVPIPCTSISNIACPGIGGTSTTPTWPAGTTFLGSTINTGNSFFTMNGFGSGLAASVPITTTGFTSGVAAIVTGSGFYFA